MRILLTAFLAIALLFAAPPAPTAAACNMTGWGSDTTWRLIATENNVSNATMAHAYLEVQHDLFNDMPSYGIIQEYIVIYGQQSGYVAAGIWYNATLPPAERIPYLIGWIVGEDGQLRAYREIGLYSGTDTAVVELRKTDQGFGFTTWTIYFQGYTMLSYNGIGWGSPYGTRVGQHLYTKGLRNIIGGRTPDPMAFTELLEAANYTTGAAVDGTPHAYYNDYAGNGMQDDGVSIGFKTRYMWDWRCY